MFDGDLPDLDLNSGDRLAHSKYRKDFKDSLDRLRDGDSWKLERRQSFEETGSPSRMALREGNWDLSLRLLEDKRESFRRAVQSDRENGSTFHRLRVVEKPFTPYMQWQLHSLRIEAECGTPIRVVPVGMVVGKEFDKPLPEVVAIGGDVLYQVIYTDSGVPDGAVRFTDPVVVRQWVGFIHALFDQGEDVITFVDREVAHLPPPARGVNDQPY